MLNPNCLQRPTNTTVAPAPTPASSSFEEEKLNWQEYKKKVFLGKYLPHEFQNRTLREYLGDLWDENPDRNWEEIIKNLLRPANQKLAARFWGCGHHNGYEGYFGWEYDVAIPPPILKGQLPYKAYFEYAYRDGEAQGGMDA